MLGSELSGNEKPSDFPGKLGERIRDEPNTVKSSIESVCWGLTEPQEVRVRNSIEMLWIANSVEI